MPNIKVQRARKNWTQKELESKTGIPQWRISLLERGIKPREDEAKKIKRAFNRDS
jgi:predicted transcriptional regulator